MAEIKEYAIKAKDGGCFSMALIHNGFLLENNTAETLYGRYAADLPVFDYHCHLKADDIVEKRQISEYDQGLAGKQPL